jgi:uncharacterized membrane protein YhaH (DUF805 family)
VVTSWSEQTSVDGNGEPIVFYPRSGFAGAILAGFFDSSPGNFSAYSFHTSLNDNPILMLMALVLYAWIAICITVKRLHDMDATGWLSIPVVLIPIAVILVGSFPGTVGPNQFGPDPLQRKAAS